MTPFLGQLECAVVLLQPILVVVAGEVLLQVWTAGDDASGCPETFAHN